MKVKVKQKDQKMIVRAKLPRGLKVDPQGIEFFRQNVVRGLLNPVQDSVKSSSVEYTGPISIPLSAWLSEPKMSVQYYQMIMQVIDLSDRLEQQRIPFGYVNLEVDNVFINVNTNEMYFIFLPYQAEPPFVDLRQFLEVISQMYIPMSPADDNARNELVFFMQSLPFADLKAIEKLIAQRNPDIVKRVRRIGLARTSPSGFVQPQNPGPRPAPVPGAMPGPGMMPGPGGMPGAGPNGMPGPAPAGGMPGMPGQVGQGIPVNPAGPGPMPIGGMNNQPGQGNYDFDETMVVRPDMADTPVFPGPSGAGAPGPMPGGAPAGGMNPMPSGSFDYDDTMVVGVGVNQNGAPAGGMAGGMVQPEPFTPWCTLTRVRTNERFTIDKQVFRLGREKTCDYQVRGNTSVGRAHADLVLRGRTCYVVDRNSMNKTYINNSALVPQIETPINNGDHLRLADEDFVFTLL